jgi:hypothetical protein
MNQQIEDHIIKPILPFLNKPIQHVCYYDTFPKDDLTDNQKGIHIVAHQVQFDFDENSSLFISWNNVKGWEQYTIDCSNTSYVTHSECFQMNGNKYWAKLIGHKIISFKLFGYKTYERKVKDTNGNLIEFSKFIDQPHLISFGLDSNDEIGFSNCYLEKDFKPKIAIGDDIWIFFKKTDINQLIKTLELEMIAAESKPL